MIKIPNELNAACRKNGRLRGHRVKAKLGDIVSRIPHLIDPVADTVSAVHRGAKDALESKLSISVNLSAKRLVGLIASGHLEATSPSENLELEFRKKAESCFGRGAAGNIKYGALNLDPIRGGAPSFGSDAWLEIRPEAVLNSCTFTLRDSYAVTLPFFSRFDLGSGRKSLEREIFRWKGALEAYLDRFWLIQEDGPDYIEVQMWDQVSLSEISFFHLRKPILPVVHREVLKLKDGARKWPDVEPRIITYD